MKNPGQKQTKTCILCGKEKLVADFLDQKLSYLRKYHKTCNQCRTAIAEDEGGRGGKGSKLQLGPPEEGAIAGKLQEAADAQKAQDSLDARDADNEKDKQKDDAKADNDSSSDKDQAATSDESDVTQTQDADSSTEQGFLNNIEKALTHGGLHNFTAQGMQAHSALSAGAQTQTSAASQQSAQQTESNNQSSQNTDIGNQKSNQITQQGQAQQHATNPNASTSMFGNSSSAATAAKNAGVKAPVSLLGGKATLSGHTSASPQQEQAAQAKSTQQAANRAEAKANNNTNFTGGRGR